MIREVIDQLSNQIDIIMVSSSRVVMPGGVGDRVPPHLSF